MAQDDPEAQRALVVERASSAAVSELDASVTSFVEEISDLADDCKPMQATLRN